MSAKARVLNAIGAIPDRLLLAVPDVTVRKTSIDRETYLRRLGFYDPDSWNPERNPFFYLPYEPPEGEIIETKPFLSGRRDLFRYASRYIPRNPEMSDDFFSLRENLSGYLHLWRHDESAGRPLIFIVHGLMMGGPTRARRMFKLEALFQLGLDVALHTLPGHWRRSDIPRFQRLLDPADVPLTVERLAQNIHDLHSAQLLLRKIGYEDIGVIGASMGGFTAALYAAQVKGGPDFMFMAVPSVAVTHYLKPRPRRFGFPVDDALVRATERAQELCSPLYLRPSFDVGRIRVVVHAGDRVCDVRDTRRWRDSWGIEDYKEVVGGHFLYLDKRARGEAWYGLLIERGYIGRGKCDGSPTRFPVNI
jgi:pimeloyl-ACP methyl ester carboxylesterase